jgi:hypothetical protein
MSFNTLSDELLIAIFESLESGESDIPSKQSLYNLALPFYEQFLGAQS